MELLNRQEANFTSFTKLIMENTTARIDGIMKEVQDLESSLQFSQAQTDELPSMEKKVGLFETQLQSLSSQCTANVNNWLHGESERKKQY